MAEVSLCVSVVSQLDRKKAPAVLSPLSSAFCLVLSTENWHLDGSHSMNEGMRKLMKNTPSWVVLRAMDIQEDLSL